MLEYLINLKNFIIGVIIAIFAYLNPIAGEMQSLLYLFACNFFFGLIADIVARHKGFNLRKAFRAITETMVFFIIIASIYYIADRKGDVEAAIQCISFISYSVIYFYTVNILRNILLILKKELPAWKAVHFIYYVLSVEFVKKVPYLKEWLENNHNHNHDESDNKGRFKKDI